MHTPLRCCRSSNDLIANENSLASGNEAETALDLGHLVVVVGQIADPVGGRRAARREAGRGLYVAGRAEARLALRGNELLRVFRVEDERVLPFCTAAVVIPALSGLRIIAEVAFREVCESERSISRRTVVLTELACPSLTERLEDEVAGVEIGCEREDRRNGLRTVRLLVERRAGLDGRIDRVLIRPAAAHRRPGIGESAEVAIERQV